MYASYVHLTFQAAIIWLMLVGEGRPCILLLNGWKPLSISRKTHRADVVVRGRVQKTYKGSSNQPTYSAKIKVLDVYKGQSILEDLTNLDNGLIYNVSNFGSRTRCFSDVQSNKRYLFFLTTFNRRLSAKYDDLFGAADEDSEINIRHVLRALGWEDWSPWQPCSASCGRGIQNRVRRCRRKPNVKRCLGPTNEKRSCNIFKCKNTTNLLQLFKKIRVNGQSGRNIKNRTSYEKTLHNFALVASIKLSHGWTGTLFIVQHHFGYELSISYTNKVITVRKRFHGDSTEQVNETYDIEYNLSDKSTHEFIFRLQQNKLCIIQDCIKAKCIRWNLSQTDDSKNETVLDFGLKSRNKKSFIESCRKLLLIDNISNKELLCDKPVLQIEYINHEENKAVKLAPNDENSKQISWSPWSACSSTCGLGVQTRELQCDSNYVHNNDCLRKNIPRFQARLCRMKDCKDLCQTPCLNGGTCSLHGTCVCPRGFYGHKCQHASCYPGCYNGGRCKSPSVCQCPDGYEGDLCETAICPNPCQNGGHCIKPGVCSCAYGYIPPDCKSPYCLSPCLNGGSCLVPNKCTCAPGYTGVSCETGLCSESCQNGGTCIGRDLCSCTNGFKGKLCEKGICRRPCLNGGICIGRNKCKCTSKFHGRYCKRKRKCRSKGRRLHLITRRYRKPIVFKVSVPCGPWLTKICVQTKIHYITITSRVYKRRRKKCRRKGQSYSVNVNIERS